MPSSQPIGVFDSGYGGLTVLKSIVQKLPAYDFIYLGDKRVHLMATGLLKLFINIPGSAFNGFFPKAARLSSLPVTPLQQKLCALFSNRILLNSVRRTVCWV
jgi:hypothetical protein